MYTKNIAQEEGGGVHDCQSLFHINVCLVLPCCFCPPSTTITSSSLSLQCLYPYSVRVCVRVCVCVCVCVCVSPCTLSLSLVCVCCSPEYDLLVLVPRPCGYHRCGFLQQCSALCCSWAPAGRPRGRPQGLEDSYVSMCRGPSPSGLRYAGSYKPPGSAYYTHGIMAN